MQSPPHEHQHLVIGIDVGGTNTDAVAFRGKSLVAAAKVPTSSDFSTGVAEVVARLNIDFQKVSVVCLGTTVFVNALLEGRGLTRTAVVRLCGPSARALAPLVDFPPSLLDIVCAGTWFASGGLYFDGKREELSLNESELQEIASEIAATHAEAVVVSGTFSPCNHDQEQRAAEVLRQSLGPNIRVSISCQSGRLGLLSRENAAVLDACLHGTAQRTALSVQRALRSAGLPKITKFFFTANDGSVISFREAATSPLRCVACGPTNSLRGAAFLTATSSSDNMDRIVLDVGGTSTDAGCLVGGVYPRRANAEAYIAGVRCNQRTTDVVSIALGGGSIVSTDGRSIGPESVGADITREALCFGGSICTATCVAVAMGVDMRIPSDVAGAAHEKLTQSVSFSLEFVAVAWDSMQQRFLDLVERTRTDARPIEVLVVGGGAGLVDVDRLSKALGPECGVSRPKAWASVANACGSALAEAAGEVEAIADLSVEARETLLAGLKAKACALAGQNAQVTECEEVPLAYLPGKVSRIYVRAVAPLDLASEKFSLEDEADVQGCPSLSQKPPALRKPDPLPVSPSPPMVKDGAWIVSEYDAMCLSIGCGILGCGGGGSTRHGLLQLLAAIREGQPIQVISANCVPGDALVAPCAFMGAPTVSLERIDSPDCLVAAISRNLDMASNKNAPLFIMLSEVGGSNGLQPLLVGGTMDRPIVDADLMGRAFPELQMTTTAISGHPQTPMTASDAFCRCVCLSSTTGTACDDMYWTERVLRPVCVEFGCSAGLSDPLIKGSDLRRVAVCGSLSRARRMGDCILRSAHPREAITKLLESESGKILFEGKVSDVQRETTAGFARGRLTILGKDNSSSVIIEFQNEFLIARLVDTDGKAKMIGCVPDIISLVDADSARPVATEEVRFGFRICVLLLPVPKLLRTPEALRVVGPEAFGLEDSYESILDEDAGNAQDISIADS